MGTVPVTHPRLMDSDDGFTERVVFDGSASRFATSISK